MVTANVIRGGYLERQHYYCSVLLEREKGGGTIPLHPQPPTSSAVFLLGQNHKNLSEKMISAQQYYEIIWILIGKLG